MRIFSSAEYCLRVARRMSWTTFSAGSLDDRVCCLIFAPVNVTMSQKLSLLQSANSVSRALTADSDGSAFDQLKLLVDSEGDDLAGPDWRGMLAAIGIVKGQPFTPNAHAREILDLAARIAYKTSRVIGFEEIVSGLSLKVY